MKINEANTNGTASIIIPKKAMKDLNWNIGDECKMKADVAGERLIITKVAADEKEYR